MLKKSIIKKTLFSSFIAIQCLTVVPHVQAFAYSSNYSSNYKMSNIKPEIILFGYQDDDDLKAKIIQDSTFIRNWATVAHSMGFAWCGGTASKSVGNGFEFRMAYENSKPVYYLTSRYNENDPYAKGWRANERLTMKITNVRFIIDDSSIHLGTPKVTNLEPLTSKSMEVINPNNTEGKGSLNFNYISSQSKSKTDNFKFSEKIGVKTTFSVDIALINNKIETSFDFSSEQGWSTSTNNTETKQDSVSYTTTISPNSKKTVYLDVLRKKCDVPYDATIYMEYDIEFTGFLKYSGNARKDHPKDRPTVSFKFGGKNNMSAVEHLADLYKHKDINGYSNWDWKWIDTNYGKCFSNAYYNLNNLYYGGVISGVFNNVDGSKAIVKEGTEVPLNKEKSERSADSNVKVENVKTQEVPGFKVKDITISTSDGTTTINSKN
ncbi:aerolysin family beta-barrel pore-forming toxin [Clostridium botulinum C]|uniref:Aerolysin family beta-barrel pore-forming toxin n=2 Tax=Clostridium botulinum TaxID=1491 RepID=A0A9Q4XVL7_CLOBO|nr:aerolysin family beta-barrel pore-forming toxin [Clostridium botulinum]MCD3195796.1 aerolysin family beta-barrel pore-forming toxin [Clostridium botulinum C]MCD3201212.1 aerolysin family beta-barrel pore-forming toxin [Clostridium botulinum C]MCD3206537.1 aerolysin family beta-barrel pore-forming toxin [Clostridium botulinum C]MCD3209168.1 aerolysin family beta-barrel pore-forming toxin [Clostridium botulinum C]MCD3226355.1 aerolysin family beta-barrel pore-forming toxin [Clostridium botuli